MAFWKNKITKIITLIIICFSLTCINVYSVKADENIYLGGFTAGFSLNTRGAYVVGLSEVSSNGASYSPSKDAGIKTGDVILEISGNEVNTSEDIEKEICEKNEVLVKLLRGEEEIITTIYPKKDYLGINRIGVFIKNNISGIGTITYIKNGKYASLGHPVLNENGNLLNIIGGNLYNCTITGAIKGERGKAGELKGVFLKDKPFANAKINNFTGVYGELFKDNLSCKLKAIELGEAKVGDACIYTTVNGDTPQEYSISIIKADKNEQSNKNLVIKITDESLINITGGIVQGMSGSPIIQNGKLVGAVTHVFINDPERGFGIMIDKMSI